MFFTQTDSYDSRALDGNLTSLREGIPLSEQSPRQAVNRMALQNQVLEGAFADIESKTSSFVDLSGPLDVVDFVELVRCVCVCACVFIFERGVHGYIY